METNPDINTQVVYLSHGGGPLPLLEDPDHQAMITFMKDLPSQLKKPDAIVVVSAHWEETVPTLLSSESPPLLYDYYGFPEDAYQITYPAPGNPALANQIKRLLETSGFTCGLDDQRGFDHGLYIPLALMYPSADIPVIQLSLVKGLDARSHVKIGRALRGIMTSNILIIGSGFSFHNMNAFFPHGGCVPDPENDAFQEWLIETCRGDLLPEEQTQRLISWEEAPAARYCHPREEHLLPLHVCAGMANQQAKLIFDDYIAGKRAIAFLW